MSNFKAITHQIRFPLGLRSRPHWGAYSASRDPPAVFIGHTCNGREGRGGGVKYLVHPKLWHGALVPPLKTW